MASAPTDPTLAGTPGSGDTPSGWLQRMARRLQPGRSAAPSDPAAATGGLPAGWPTLPATLAQAVNARLCSAAEAVAHIADGAQVYAGSACATPRALIAALEARQPAAHGVTLLHFLLDGALPHDAQGRCTTTLRHRCWFVGANQRAAVAQGLADYVPLSLAEVPRLMADGRIGVDVALVQVSPPDAFGWVSLGVSVDVALAAVARARLVIAEVNPAMPRTGGASLLHLDQIDHLVAVDTPLIAYTHPATAAPVVERIARYISSIIDDGSTLQIGLGRFSHEALRHLSDRRDLGVHSDVITDALLPLIDAGVVTGRAKGTQPGRIVASLAMGSPALYERMNGNPLFELQPIDAVCAPATLAAQHKLVSVTQAFAVDLGGQVCTEQLDGQAYGGLAAQLEFLRAAARSAGGKAIVCLASTSEDGTRSRIRLALDAGAPVSVPRSDVHYVITEYGIAYLFGRSQRERALALIGVAHPDFRDGLLAEAIAAGLLPAGQELRSRQAYAVEDERTLALRDGRSLLLRPAVATDGEGVRALFHRLPERDVYTRFFRRVRSLSDRDTQRLCNLDGEREVGFVAVTGPRENPEVVAHAFYVLDPGSNLAETAFMVHPGWQGSGLGGALQQLLAEHARRRGVRGLVAEVLASNTAMVQLARRASEQVSLHSDDGTVRVTALL
ncbi:GNAT family N-acetyltransferase [Ideonella sp. DXS22W]|uniref:GNAT family N-acetyltransferase n=1 Tax=Pseudaquabacterium inlustre TaxID=2984192 RepID=A0ABU9CD52_9BURK